MHDKAKNGQSQCLFLLDGMDNMFFIGLLYEQWINVNLLKPVGYAHKANVAQIWSKSWW